MAGLLRSRWTQENFFKYLREEFGLDTLAEHALEDVSEDEMVVNPLWRYLDNAVTKFSRRCAGLHRRRAQAKRGSEAAAKLQAQFETAERRLEGLQIARRQLPRQVRVGELSANERPQALAEPLRVLLQAADNVLNFCARVADCFVDHRAAARCEYSVQDLVSQRLYGLALGYEDLNDHDQLLALALGRSDVSGQDRARERDRGHPLAGSSTLNRQGHFLVRD